MSFISSQTTLVIDLYCYNAIYSRKQKYVRFGRKYVMWSSGSFLVNMIIKHIDPLFERQHSLTYHKNEGIGVHVWPVNFKWIKKTAPSVIIHTYILDLDFE